MTRRDFLRAWGGAGGLALLGPRAWSASANERVVVAHIGVGGMGSSHLGWFAAMPDVETAALCDVDEVRLGEAMKRLRELRPETKAEAYTDFRRVLDRGDIDAVTYATPDHWHALMAVRAFEAGKDVYGEKPLCYCLAEGQAMLRAMRRHDRIFQLGTQIHAGENFHRVAELVQSGILGRVHTVRLWKTGGSPDLGFPAPEPIPPTLNWEQWLGPAPYAEYSSKRCHFNFRYFLDYSGGTFQDFWCHIADILFWSLNPQRLRSVSSRGERPMDTSADAPAWLDADFEFKDLHVHWTTKPPEAEGAKDRGIGAFFEGTKGTLICDYDTRELCLDGQRMKDVPEVPKTLPRSPGHQRNFIDSVRSRALPESHLEYARRMTIPMHLAMVSYRLKRGIEWDSKDERCVGDEAANRLLSRPYRGHWSLA